MRINSNTVCIYNILYAVICNREAARENLQGNMTRKQYFQERKKQSDVSFLIPSKANVSFSSLCYPNLIKFFNS